MRDHIAKLTAAARDYCYHAERLTNLRRAARQPCEIEDGPEFPKCHQRLAGDGDWHSPFLPKSEWCARCREFEENRTAFRVAKDEKAKAESRMRYAWRRIVKVQP